MWRNREVNSRKELTESVNIDIFYNQQVWDHLEWQAGQLTSLAELESGLQ